VRICRVTGNTSLEICINFTRLFFVQNTKLPFKQSSSRISDEMFPQEQVFRLCQATTVNKELLIKLVQDKIVIDGDIDHSKYDTFFLFSNYLCNIATRFIDS